MSSSFLVILAKLCTGVTLGKPTEFANLDATTMFMPDLEEMLILHRDVRIEHEKIFRGAFSYEFLPLLVHCQSVILMDVLVMSLREMNLTVCKKATITEQKKTIEHADSRMSGCQEKKEKKSALTWLVSGILSANSARSFKYSMAASRRQQSRILKLATPVEDDSHLLILVTVPLQTPNNMQNMF